MGRGQGQHGDLENLTKQTRGDKDNPHPEDLIYGYSVATILDFDLLEKEAEAVKADYARRGISGEQIDELIELNKERKNLLPVLENAVFEKKKISKEIGVRKQKGESADDLVARVQELKETIKENEARLYLVEHELGNKALALPNRPAADVPSGDTEEDAKIIRVVGERPEFNFPVQDHLELSKNLGIIDTESAARLSGSRFAYLKGDLVRTQMALNNYALDLLSKHGHELVVPPVLVREQALYGSGFFPEEKDNIYRLGKDDMFLTGTSEVALANLHAKEIIPAEELPLRYAGMSTCFRREAGSAGKDTTGIFRVHQFDKIEMFSFVTPDKSKEEQDRLLSIEEEILKDLELPYQVVNISAGDLGASAAKKYDCEVWFPSQNRYRELTSCSNTTDYQARRLSIKSKNESGQREYIHTLNGTAIAIGRTLAALIENRQEEDGSISLPDKLADHGAPARIERKE